MNGRQLLFVLVGIGVFVTGVFIGVSPVEAGLPEEGQPSAVPLLDPIEAFRRRPSRVFLALGLVLLGLATAAAGAYLGRDRR